jgi:hypothetical protein
MKAFSLSVVLATCISCPVLCQSIDRHVITSGGSYLGLSGGRFQNTIGQPLASAASNSSHRIVIGFQQFLVRNITSADAPHARFITLYPNPTEGNTIVQTSGEFVISEWQLTTLNGLIVEVPSSNLSSGYQLDLGSIPSGIYFLQIRSSQGRISVIKIVKQ